MKAIPLLSAAAVVAAAVIVTFINLRARDTLDDQRQELQVQLLQQVELNTTQRLQLEDQIQTLETNLAAASNQITNLSQALQEAREMADPNLGELREQLRQEVEAELREDPMAMVRLTSSQVQSDMLLVTARGQLYAQYGDFLNSLAIDEDRHQRISDLLLSLLAEQVQVATTGDEDERYQQLRSTDYMLRQLTPLLTIDEQQAFVDYQDSMPERDARRRYNTDVLSAGPGLSEANRQFLVDAMMEHLEGARNNYFQDLDSEPEDYVQSQLDALQNIRRSVDGEFEGNQLREAYNVLQRQQALLEMTRARADSLSDQ